MKVNDNIQPFRLHIPKYERILPWVSSLLDCYASIDFSVSEIIQQSKKNIACHKGCAACCYHIIPLSIIEILGIRFYVNTILDKRLHQLIIKSHSQNKKICLFNIDNCCAIYPFRPIACRRYIVTSECCNMDEDPISSRPNDVLIPSRELLYNAILHTLPFYNAQNSQNLSGKDIFDFYKKNNLILSSVYDKILK